MRMAQHEELTLLMVPVLEARRWAVERGYLDASERVVLITNSQACPSYELVVTYTLTIGTLPANLV